MKMRLQVTQVKTSLVGGATVSASVTLAVLTEPTDQAANPEWTPWGQIGVQIANKSDGLRHFPMGAIFAGELKREDLLPGELAAQVGE